MKLANKKVIVLVEDNYDDLEFWYPVLRLKEEGCAVIVVGTGSKSIYTSKHGIEAEVDIDAANTSSLEFDGIIIPGGWAPDKLRRVSSVKKLVNEFSTQGKMIATICHGPWVLISSKVIRGYKVTCTQGIVDDVLNAGAEYIDSEVVEDRNIITSRSPTDLPAFMRTIIEHLSKDHK